MALTLAAATLGGGIISGLSSLIGGSKTAKGIAEANRQNIALAKEQMAFQERMSSTAHQRAAADMEAAGLNRILALGKPASTPAGQTARVENVQAPRGAAIAAAGGQIMSTARQIAEIKNIEANTAQTTADTANKTTQNLIMEHGEEIASIAADIARTVRALIGNKTPEEIAALIQQQITKATSALTNAMEAFSGMDVKGALEQVKKDVGRYIYQSITPNAPQHPQRQLDTQYERYQRETKGKDISFNEWRKRQ